MRRPTRTWRTVGNLGQCSFERRNQLFAPAARTGPDAASSGRDASPCLGASSAGFASRAWQRVARTTSGCEPDSRRVFESVFCRDSARSAGRGVGGAWVSPPDGVVFGRSRQGRPPRWSLRAGFVAPRLGPRGCAAGFVAPRLRTGGRSAAGLVAPRLGTGGRSTARLVAPRLGSARLRLRGLSRHGCAPGGAPRGLSRHGWEPRRRSAARPGVIWLRATVANPGAALRDLSCPSGPLS